MADGKPGRRTKDEEIRAWLSENGMNPDLANRRDGDPPLTPTAQEMRDAFMEILYRKRESLGATALVQGMKALVTLAELEEKATPAPEDALPPLLERLDALPADHAAGLLEGEIARLRGELEAHSAALEKLKGTA